jgi:hypothetical protein
VSSTLTISSGSSFTGSGVAGFISFLGLGASILGGINTPGS